MRDNLKWAIASRVLAVVLVTAALLKLYQLLTAPTLPGAAGPHERWIAAGAAEVEIVLGSWLLAVSGGRATWTVTLLAWSVFVCVAAHAVAVNASSCGCFGAVRINPMYTLTFDCACIVAIVLCRPKPDNMGRGGTRLGRRQWLVMGTVAMVSLLFGTWSALHVQAGTSKDIGIIDAGEVTILEPEKWVGHQFALSESIDCGRSVMSGTWVVVIFHHDCDHCRRAVPKYEALAEQTREVRGSPGIATVEMPPYADAGHELVAPGVAALAGRLSDKHEWFAQTPVVVKLIDGQVVAVATGEQAEDPAFIMGAGNAH